MATTNSLGEIVVAAPTQTKWQVGDLSSTEETSFCTVIYPQQNNNAISSIEELLEKETAIQIKETAGAGSHAEISLRGCSSNQVTILLDGVPLNQASGGAVDLSTISINDIEAIEIYKNRSPFNSATSLPGGAINLRTKRANKSKWLKVAGGYGSFKTIRAEISANYAFKNWHWLTANSYQQSDNDFKFLNNIGTDYNSNDDKIEKRTNNNFYQFSSLIKGNCDFGKQQNISLNQQFFFKDAGLADWTNSKNCQARLILFREFFSLRHQKTNLSALNILLANNFNFSYQHEIYDDQHSTLGLGAQLNNYLTTNFNYKGYAELPLKWQLLKASWEYQFGQYTQVDIIDDYQKTIPLRRNQASFAFADNFFFWKQKIIISPEIKYHYFNDSQKNVISSSDYYFLPAIGLKIKPINWLTIKANSNLTVRPPAFYELYGDRGFLLGNKELLDEKSFNNDFGFSLNFDKPNIYLDFIKFSASGFANYQKNLIILIFNSQGIGKSANFGKTLLSGLETEFQLKIFQHFLLTSKYTWQQPINKLEREIYYNKILPGRDLHNYLQRLEFISKYFSAYFEYSYQQGMYFDSLNNFLSTTKHLLNSGLSFRYAGWHLNIDCKNLLNKNYEDYNRYPLPGLAFYSKIIYQKKF